MEIFKLVTFIFLMSQAHVAAQGQQLPTTPELRAPLNVQQRDFTQGPQQVRSKHWVFGIPLGTPLSNTLIIRDIYALSSNDKTKFADWVAYRLTTYEVRGTLDLERKWRADPWLNKEGTLEPSRPDDYKGANAKPFEYDRGHQAPLAAFKGSRHASQANYLSNITPQKKELNQGPWRILEGKIRNFVKRGGTLWVVTGPIYKEHMVPLPNADEPHIVPSGYWKIITEVRGNVVSSAAFVMNQNTPRNSPLRDHIKTVRDVEQVAGLNFYWELPASVENGLETGDMSEFIDRLLR